MAQQNTPTLPQAPVLTEPDAARFINMSRAYLRAARRGTDGPPFLRIGRAVRYRRDDLDAWLSARVVTRSR